MEHPGRTHRRKGLEFNSDPYKSRPAQAPRKHVAVSAARYAVFGRKEGPMYFRSEYAFLSNMYPATVKMRDGIVYSCAEAAFQAQKTYDIRVRWEFAKMSGAEAKKFGRQVELRENWDSLRVLVMYCVVYRKFEQNRDLLGKLFETGNTELVEENTWGDTFWGVCDGKGENHLGIILMQVRKELLHKYCSYAVKCE